MIVPASTPEVRHAFSLLQYGLFEWRGDRPSVGIVPMSDDDPGPLRPQAVAAKNQFLSRRLRSRLQDGKGCARTA
jgi:hypothetical protein